MENLKSFEFDVLIPAKNHSQQSVQSGASMAYKDLSLQSTVPIFQAGNSP